MTGREVIQRRRLLVAAVGALVLLVGGGLVVAGARGLAPYLPGVESCRVEAGSRTVRLSPAQAVAASRMMAAAVRSGTSLGTAATSLRDVEATGLDDAGNARAVALALSGRARAALSCTYDGDAGPASKRLGPAGLTARAAAVRRDVDRAFGPQQVGGFAPGGVRTGHMPGSAHYEGRAVDVFFRPVSRAAKVRGWALAQYLVANAARLDVATVIFDGTIWTARRSGEGWRDYAVDTAGRSPATVAILEHRDHVHVDVFA